MHDILYHYILHSCFCCIIYEYMFCCILQPLMYINKLCFTHVVFDVATNIYMSFGATLNASHLFGMDLGNRWFKQQQPFCVKLRPWV